MNDKWTMFKNYMHNELEISKDDIRVWIKEAIQKEADKIIKQTFEKYSVKQIVTELIKDLITDRRFLIVTGKHL